MCAECCVETSQTLILKSHQLFSIRLVLFSTNVSSIIQRVKIEILKQKVGFDPKIQLFRRAKQKQQQKTN